MMIFFIFLVNQPVHLLTEDCGMDLISIWVPKLTELWQVVDGKIYRHDQMMAYFVLKPHKECVQPDREHD